MYLGNHQTEVQVDEQEVAHYIDVLARCVAVGFFCFVLNVLYG
ncbi:hypothetical protein XVE_2958 [Xanthomonas vesicatoria ATCC 35937]|uniref:Uncharacterized protein n=1 Tax=Xanthomonas vesicatoria ATCC 35937 TaxID=925775 RepID=F0BFG5_9XANT|nr:hypothetical protein XVE_2958 [Xanthomonas vesicatoria ATCC 35937]